MDVGGVARRGQNERSAKHEAAQKPTMITAGVRCQQRAGAGTRSKLDSPQPAQMRSAGGQDACRTTNAEQQRHRCRRDGRASNL